jgi:hypothetical protein
LYLYLYFVFFILCILICKIIFHTCITESEVYVHWYVKYVLVLVSKVLKFMYIVWNDMFYILWFSPRKDLWNVNKLYLSNSIDFNQNQLISSQSVSCIWRDGPSNLIGIYRIWTHLTMNVQVQIMKWIPFTKTNPIQWNQTRFKRGRNIYVQYKSTLNSGEPIA